MIRGTTPTFQLKLNGESGGSLDLIIALSDNRAVYSNRITAYTE